ncbi:MAG TPA: monooxygenase [Micromonosporaceae bacterium]|nr:monooxygenase [Micromonosporaceae bacterium]
MWRVPARRAVTAFWRVARDRSRLRRTPGVRFAKILGTSPDRSFGPARADLTRWAAVITWDNPDSAAAFEDSPVGRAWATLAERRCRIDLRPLAARGSWAGRQPFGPMTLAGPRSGGNGPVLALTRARLRPSRAVTFWRAVPPPATAARTAPGLLAAFGIGEAPIGWQGTITVWRDASDLVEFAYRHRLHTEAIDRTAREGWYAEELFARFAVRAVVGDRGVMGWMDEAAE